MLGYFKVIEVRDRCRFKMNVLGFGVRLFVDMFIHRHQILFELNWMHHRCTRSWCRKNFRCRKLCTKNFVHQKLLHKKKFVNRKLHQKLSSTGSCIRKIVSRKLHQNIFQKPEVAPKYFSCTASYTIKNFRYRKLHHKNFHVLEVTPYKISSTGSCTTGSSDTGSTDTAR